ncbi:MAG: sigma-70 family RNA polymerase sigma factor [Alistipes sp.]|nr:sigma-70 family RNA polymerase sigma factor [Alistipes senegalensis]MCM1250647.1 sigma-70 family RNA polymerase sigma factor [Alistipes sp.]
MEPPKNNAADVFEKYRHRLGAFIARRVPSQEEAEDILQDVFLRFVQTDAINPVSQVAAWLFRAARNRIVDRRRKHREQPLPTLRHEGDEAGMVDEITALLADDCSSPEMEYLRRLVWEEVAKALDELPEPQREVFCLTEIEGFSFRELADDTGIPVATLLSRKHYAVKHLRRRLADLYEALLRE